MITHIFSIFYINVIIDFIFIEKKISSQFIKNKSKNTELFENNE